MSLATQYPSNRASSTQPGISRNRSGYSGQSRSSAYGARPSAAPRQGAGSRSAGQRPTGQRPSGQRPPQNRRPANGGNRRPPQRRRKKAQGRFYAFIALAVIILIALVLIIFKPFGRNDVSRNVPASTVTNPTVQPATDSFEGQVDETEEPATQYSSISEMLADQDAQVDGLSAEEMAQVSDLSINQNLPAEWLNVLLLGTDERTLSDSARTDSMMICSVNRNTGEVKLASIMRDLAIEYTDIGKWNGTYRINAANYFGGPRLAMKTVNEKFGMNIQYYVMVNFFGFQKIAQRLGGIDIDITEAEMQQINKLIVQQAKIARRAGVDESDQENVYLESYGENTHLNGRQTLAYARIRKIDNDYMRSERQRTVLSKLMQKVKGLNAIEIAALASTMIDQVKTNMPIDDIVNTALVVASNGVPDLKATRLPVTGTYSEERRNDEAMLWDCDFAANQIALYNFIYE